LGQCAELPDRALSSVTVMQTIVIPWRCNAGWFLWAALYIASVLSWSVTRAAMVRPEYCIMGIG
jgi:hypothetical protein